VTDEANIEVVEVNPTITVAENIGSITASSTTSIVTINDDSSIVVTKTVETQAVTITQNQTVLAEIESVSIITVGTQGPPGIQGEQGEPTDISHLLPYEDADDDLSMGTHNIKAATVVTTNDSTLDYLDGNLSTVTYDNGMVKTLSYNGDGTLNTNVITTPDKPTITKTYSYSDGNLVGVAIT
jgi:prophage tail gpP-like protein